MWGNMENITECAKLYETLLNKDYIFTLENNIKIKLYFSADNFYHLMGLEKLIDIEQLKGKQATKIYKQILNRNISDSIIQKSKYYYVIENRIKYFEHITDLFDFNCSNKIIVDFDVNKLSFNTKLRNTKFILYKHIENTYIHLTIGNKSKLYPETFIIENGSQYISGQTLLDILNIEVVNR